MLLRSERTGAVSMGVSAKLRVSERRAEERPRKSFCVALGGTMTSLVLLMMFMATVFPMLDYAIPTYAGFLIVVVIVEAGADWALLTYLACAFLCPLLTPDYEATLLFIMFMGYYPILYIFLMRVKRRAVRRVLKAAVFNTAMIGYAMLFQYVFTGTDIYEGLEMFGKWAPFVLLAMADLFFVFYDHILGRLIDLYIRWFRKKVLKRK